MQQKYKLGIIGCGSLAQAIIKHINIPIIVSDIEPLNLAKVASTMVKTTQNNADVISASEFVLIAVKPQMAEKILRPLNFTGKIIISVMAGISRDRLAEIVNHQTDKIVRVMPNMFAQLGESSNVFCQMNLSDDEKLFLAGFLQTFGRPFPTDERNMNAVTAVSGSGPALLLKFVNAMITAGERNGLTRRFAHDLVVRLLTCSAQLLTKAPDLSIENFIEQITCKGGTTAEALTFLNSRRFDDLVVGAVTAATIRAFEIEGQNEEGG